MSSSTVSVRMFIAVVLLKFPVPVLFFSDLYELFLSEYFGHINEFFTHQAIYQAIFENRDRWFVVTPASGEPAKGDEGMPHVIVSFCEEKRVRKEMFLRFQESRWSLKTAPRPGLLKIITEASHAIRRLLATSKDPEESLPLALLPQKAGSSSAAKRNRKTVAPCS